MLNREIAFSL